MNAPTFTEKLFYGEAGCPNPRNPYRLERDLLSLEGILSRAQKAPLPLAIQEWVDKWTDHEYDPMSEGCNIGVGHNEEVGWFVLGSGQGTFIIWMEGQEYQSPTKESDEAFWLRVKNRQRK